MQGWLKTLPVLFFVFSADVFCRETACSKEQLRQKNCLLKVGKAQYQFLRENLSINDGVWKEVVPVPLEEAGTEWQSLRVLDRGGRRFFELKIWTPQEPSVHLQSLHWAVVELIGTKTKLRLNQVIQKRRPLPDGQQGFLTDAVEKHALDVKGQRLYWTVGHLKGDF